jgi:hypothetical protein
VYLDVTARSKYRSPEATPTMGSRRTPLCALALGAVLAVVRPPSVAAQPLCGNGTIDNNEQCDGQECCTAQCTMAPNGTPCGAPAGPCRLSGGCFDFTCFDGDVLSDGTPCDDGDPCTVGETCDISFPNDVTLAQCIGGTRRCTITPTVNKAVRLVPGAAAITVDCNVPGGAGGTCSASAFLPEPPATAAVTTPGNAARAAAVEAGGADLACDFTRQITRSVTKPLDDAGMAHIKLKLNKLARRLLRKLPVSDMVSLTVCTKIDFPNGDSITLVDVVNAARR